MMATEDTPSMDRMFAGIREAKVLWGENDATGPMSPKPAKKAKPDDWVGDLLEVWAADTDGFARTLHFAAMREALDDGMQAQHASRVAVRVARLGVLRIRGYDQATAAKVLDVSERTAKSDAARIRAVLEPGQATFRYQPQGRPPDVPLPPGDVIRPTIPPVGRRRRRASRF